MKRIMVLFICCCLVFGLAACSSKENNRPTTTTPTGEKIITSESNILIAYFSWADNTVVTDEEAAVKSALEHFKSVGDHGEYVDAISSASVVKPGNVSQMATWIQERTGGDIFPIVTTEPYPSDYNECLDRAADEKAENARPKLVGRVENIEDYDVIFLGFPNWWYTAPMAIFSFIEEYDLSEKTIIPFCAHGTGGIAGSVKDITASLPESTTVLEPIGIYRTDINSAQPTINEWLNTLGFTETESSSEVSTSETESLESVTKTVRMTVNGQEIKVTLNDAPLANALYDMLPLELTFEDFNGTEKIAYLPDGQSLSTDGINGGHEPVVGDLCLYAPWGNLCIFYKNFRYSDDLYSIGHIDSSIDVLSGMDGNFTVVLEKGN